VDDGSDSQIASSNNIRLVFAEVASIKWS